MYAELFRAIGWMVSDDPEKALKFRFTLLGDHAAVADVDPKSIFEVSVLGINYPNRILAIKGTEASRTFAAILKVASKLDDHICRDEIIIGILNHDDIGDTAIDDIASSIKELRGSSARLSAAIKSLSHQLGIQKNTMQNYTRFPLAVLTYCGWFERVSTKQFYPGGRPTVMFKLTSYGKKISEELFQMEDMRLSDYEIHSTERQKALIRVGFYTMLQRANFDISPAITQLLNDHNILSDVIGDRELLFSPYQTLRPELADDALGYVRDIQAETGQATTTTAQPSGIQRALPYQVTTIRLSPIGSAIVTTTGDSDVTKKIAESIRNGQSDDEIAETLFAEYRSATKEVFYPLIADLFTIIGFKCHASRAGINYERWDAIAVDSHYSIPIEIKSPTEEMYISIKAVRQALENKVILLSRKSYITDWNTATLAVGYNPPNERAEVSRLIQEIKNTFSIKIGIIDFRSLCVLASTATRSGEKNHIDDIRQMEGLINVESI
jgi:hypothetical protein